MTASTPSTAPGRPSAFAALFAAPFACDARRLGSDGALTPDARAKMAAAYARMGLTLTGIHLHGEVPATPQGPFGEAAQHGAPIKAVGGMVALANTAPHGAWNAPRPATRWHDAWQRAYGPASLVTLPPLPWAYRRTAFALGTLMATHWNTRGHPDARALSARAKEGTLELVGGAYVFASGPLEDGDEGLTPWLAALLTAP